MDGRRVRIETKGKTLMDGIEEGFVLGRLKSGEGVIIAFLTGAS